MVDLHSHVLFGMDDGSRSIEESLEMLRKAEKLGFRGVVCTPHYKKGMFENKEYEEHFKALADAVTGEGIRVKLYRGNEFFLDLDGMEDLRKYRVRTYNDSRYLLVELDPRTPFFPAKKALEMVKDMGYHPVLAHIERSVYMDLDELRQIKDMGVVMQVNIGSMSKGYPEVVRELLSSGIADTFASDAHRSDRRTYDLLGDMEELWKFIGQDEFDRMAENSERIIRSEEIMTSGKYRKFQKKEPVNVDLKSGSKDEDTEEKAGFLSGLKKIFSKFRKN